MRFKSIGKTSSMPERRDVTRQIIEAMKQQQAEDDKKAAAQSSPKQAAAAASR